MCVAIIISAVRAGRGNFLFTFYLRVDEMHKFSKPTPSLPVLHILIIRSFVFGSLLFSTPLQPFVSLLFDLSLMDDNHRTACYAWYRILQALEEKLLNCPSIWAPVTFLLYCPISDLPSYPLPIFFAQRRTGSLNVRNYSKRKLLGAGGKVWRPNILTPPMTVNVLPEYTILQVVQRLLKDVCDFLHQPANL
jgi:hypothetical protein